MSYEVRPYTNYHELNMDWVLEEMHKAVAAWKESEKYWSNAETAFNEMQAAFDENTGYYRIQWPQFQNQINTQMNDYQNRMNNMFDDFKADMQSKQTAFEAEVSANFAEFTTDTIDEYQKFMTAQQNAYNAFVSTINEQWDTYKETMNTAFHDLTVEEAEARAKLEADVHEYVQNWFDNLNVDDEVNQQLQEYLQSPEGKGFIEEIVLGSLTEGSGTLLISSPISKNFLVGNIEGDSEISLFGGSQINRCINAYISDNVLVFDSATYSAGILSSYVFSPIRVCDRFFDLNLSSAVAMLISGSTQSRSSIITFFNDIYYPVQLGTENVYRPFLNYCEPTITFEGASTSVAVTPTTIETRFYTANNTLFFKIYLTSVPTIDSISKITLSYNKNPQIDYYKMNYTDYVRISIRANSNNVGSGDSCNFFEIGSKVNISFNSAISTNIYCIDVKTK